MAGSGFEDKLLGEHRSWLNRFNQQFGKNWEKLLLNDSEAAMCEAAVRRLLEQNGNDVEPNETLDGSKQSPDFRCIQGDKLFFVEVTCISKEKTTEQTRLNHLPKPGFSYQGFVGLTDSIFHAAKEKTPQCSYLDQPALVAVGTFHWQASNLCFERMNLELLLTGQTFLSQKIDTSTGGPVGDEYLSTKLRSATFLSPQPDGYMRSARNPVSGILACGFGCEPPKVRGALHPEPVHVFDRKLLANLEFCRLRPEYKGGLLSAEWF